MHTEAPSKRSIDELAKLKNEWRADPCWDLEQTEGFEAHYEELLAFRKQWESKWEAEKQARLEKRAELLGCPGTSSLLFTSRHLNTV